MTRYKLFVAIFICAVCLLNAGCGASTRPDLSPVKGKVTYQGKAVNDATVVFLCPGAPRPAIGTTDDQGNFQLTTYEANDGAMIGMHTVTVKKYASQTETAEPVPQNPKEMAKAIEKSMHQSAQVATQAEDSRSLLPEKYAQMKTSGLEIEVVLGENVIDIELKD
jgi:hypothetical protein